MATPASSRFGTRGSHYSWPGNVRELKNICRTAVILGRGTSIEAHDIRIESKVESQTSKAPPATAHPLPVWVSSGEDLRQLSSQFERDLITKMLGEPDANQSSVAKRLNISVRTLQRILNRDGRDNKDSFVL